MEIKYLGHSSFLIKSKDAKLVTDPYDEKMVGLKFPKVEANVVTVSHDHKDHNQTKQVDGNPLVIDWPGQFEKNGIRVTGYKSYHDNKQGAERGENIMYKIEAEGVSILHCGDLGATLDDAFIDEVGEVDILLVPVGGHYTIDSSEAVNLIKKIEPSIVIPMHFKKPDDKESNLAPVSDFLKKIGTENITPIPKLVVKREEFEEEMKVVILQVSS